MYEILDKVLPFLWKWCLILGFSFIVLAMIVWCITSLVLVIYGEIP